MQVKSIPEDTQVALMAILPKYVPEITPMKLVSALRSYEPELAAASGEPADFQKPMTKREVAGLLGVSLPTVDRLLADGRLRKIDTGVRRVRIDRRSVAEYLKG